MMNYIQNDAIFRVTFRNVTRRESVGYIVADTWERASAIAIDYCIEKSAHLIGVELLRDTQEASIANNAIVLIDNNSL